MAISDRIFRFPNASFKATKKVEMKYMSTMPKMSTYFFSVFIGKYSLRKSCLICWFFRIWRPSTESCRFEIIARLKFTQLAKIILTRPPNFNHTTCPVGPSFITAESRQATITTTTGSSQESPDTAKFRRCRNNCVIIVKKLWRSWVQVLQRNFQSELNGGRVGVELELYGHEVTLGADIHS